jgi:hypothetical protein
MKKCFKIGGCIVLNNRLDDQALVLYSFIIERKPKKYHMMVFFSREQGGLAGDS